MKALTLTQPWAQLVAIGAKKVETRSWSTDYRGPVAIHAAKAFPADSKELVWKEPFMRRLREAEVIRFNIFAGIAGEGEAYLPVGAVIATAKLSDVWRVDRVDAATRWGLTEDELAFGNYAIGRYAWFLREVELLSEPVAARGSLGLWEWAPVEVPA